MIDWILGIATSDLKADFDSVASDFAGDPYTYARNLLEYCCYRALALSMQAVGYLADKKFRRLTFDMMLAWECPAAASQPLLTVDDDAAAGLEAFSRVAPAVPIIANVVISKNLFQVLTASTGGRLQYSIYEKYLIGLERAIKKLKNQSDSSLLSELRLNRREKIVELDGTVTTQPVLQHLGISTWPGRLILTDHALYFEPLKVVSYDKATCYDLEDDLKQSVKPELTGPWGTRLFDKAVAYKSITLSEPVVMEFPELKGHSRRDYWLAIIQEILFAHKFIRKYKIVGIGREEALLKAVLGILRLQAIQDMNLVGPVRHEALLLFNLCDQLPGGDMILETLASMSTSRELERTNSPRRRGLYSSSASAVITSLGFGFGSVDHTNDKLLVGELAVGGTTPLEKVVNESRNSYEKVVLAQETVDGVKVDGIDTNLAVMKELLFPVMELLKSIFSLAYWEEPLKSLLFCTIFTYIITRQGFLLTFARHDKWITSLQSKEEYGLGWFAYVLVSPLIFLSIFMLLTLWFSKGRPVAEVKVIAPPAKNAMEQLLAVQNAVSQAEESIQYGNIVLLKLRALLLSIAPQASRICATVLSIMAVVIAFVPIKYIMLLSFLEAFTRYSPPRKASTERWERRFREWWFSIPAAPVMLEREKEDKKRK
ncbi:Lysophospholipase nte1 [Bienertia sinuspersici]